MAQKKVNKIKKDVVAPVEAKTEAPKVEAQKLPAVIEAPKRPEKKMDVGEALSWVSNIRDKLGVIDDAEAALRTAANAETSAREAKASLDKHIATMGPELTALEGKVRNAQVQLEGINVKIEKQRESYKLEEVKLREANVAAKEKMNKDYEEQFTARSVKLREVEDEIEARTVELQEVKDQVAGANKLLEQVRAKVK